MNTRGTPKFWKAYRALPPEIREATRSAYRKFLENPAHPSLRLERLRSDPRFWSVRVTRDYRAVAQRVGDNWEVLPCFRWSQACFNSCSAG